MNKVRFAAYGTLRKGSYNYDRFKRHFQDDFNHVETIETKGIKMYDCTSGHYPYGVKDEKSDVIIDIIECSQSCFDAITGMEYGAGYNLTTIIIDNKPVHTFLLNNEGQNWAGSKIVPKDWVKYEKENHTN